MASGWLLGRQIGGPLGGRAFSRALATNLSIGLVALLLLEGAVRIAARTTPDGLVVGPVAIRPTWSELTAESRAVLAGAVRWDTWDPAYLVPDPQLGWTVAPDRRSADGLYASSRDGMRTALEVPFTESWGHHLER